MASPVHSWFRLVAAASLIFATTALPIAVPTPAFASCSPSETNYTSGGTVYRVVTFTATGSCTWSVPTGITSLDIVAVGGGGGGGADAGTGGGGGAIVSLTATSPRSTITIFVGTGGTGGVNRGNLTTAEDAAKNGGDSTVDWTGDATVDVTADGGYGGGSWQSRLGATAATTTTGLGGQASASAPSASATNGGSGGAAAADGSGTTIRVGGVGTDGTSNSISGSAVSYGAGGGGGISGLRSNATQASSAGAAGGTTGGGSGASYTASTGNSAGGAGTNGYGAGGGGGGAYGDGFDSSRIRTSGGAGGSGVVILRYIASPGAPTITGITPGNGQLSVAFTASSSDGGSAITNYQYSTDGGSNFTAVSPAATTSPIVITGLTNGTAYNVQLRAVNAVGNGTATSSTSGTPRTVPGAPTGASASAGDGQATVSWTAPSSNGGSTITGYTATSSPAGRTCTTTLTSCTITGLSNGTSHTFTVVATNAAGNSSASGATAAVTPTSAPATDSGGSSSSDSPSSTTPSTTTPSTTTPSTTTPSTGGAGVMTPSPVTQRPNTGGVTQLPVGPAPATVQVLTTPKITTDPNRLVATTINDLRSTKGAAVAARVQAALEASIPSISSEIAAATAQLATVLSRRNAPQSEVIRAQANLANATSLVILRTLEATGGNLTSLSLPITKESRLPQVRPKGVLVVGPDGAKSIQRTIRDNSTVVVREFGGSFSLAMSVIEKDGRRAPVSAQGTVRAAPGQKIAVAGNGYRPRSPVVMWVFSSPRNLGTVMTDENGAFAAEIPMPNNLMPGEHTAQVNGEVLDGDLRSINLGIEVALESPAPPTNGTVTLARTADTFINFRPASAELTKGAKANLRELVAGAKGKKIKQARVDGKTFYIAADFARELARERVAAISGHLRKLGVKQKIQKRVVPTKEIKDRQVRKYEVTLRFR